MQLWCTAHSVCYDLAPCTYVKALATHPVSFVVSAISREARQRTAYLFRLPLFAWTQLFPSFLVCLGSIIETNLPCQWNYLKSTAGLL